MVYLRLHLLTAHSCSNIINLEREQLKIYERGKSIALGSDVPVAAAAAVMFSVVKGIELSNQTGSCPVNLLPSAPCNIQWLESLHPVHTTFPVFGFQMPLAPRAICRQKAQSSVSITYHIRPFRSYNQPSFAKTRKRSTVVCILWMPLIVLTRHLFPVRHCKACMDDLV